MLPDTAPPLPDELADLQRAVAYWGGGEGVADRIDGLRSASASLTLFLEHIPHTLHDWLDARLHTGSADAACTMAAGLAELTDFLHEHRLLHMDAHFRNILTDGRRLYLADYGLSLSSRFRLAEDERGFFDRHRGYYRAYTTYQYRQIGVCSPERQPTGTPASRYSAAPRSRARSAQRSRS
ncbi:hypothetical protein ACFY0F_08245 [Streptomyces sp. NPDC001544]|uniref:hypothetical protein n=1 Tax=Streptomyces sp. NPDC001544 TaxID=3364584 RepID=UPI0036BDBE9D